MIIHVIKATKMIKKSILVSKEISAYMLSMIEDMKTDTIFVGDRVGKKWEQLNGFRKL